MLLKAVTAVLQNEDGKARGAVGGVFRQLSYKEIRPLLPAIHEAVVKPAPSGIMFADRVRPAGLGVMARHRIKEGIPLCLQIMDIDRWGKKNRIGRCLDALQAYGPAARSLLPELKKLERELGSHPEARNLQDHIDKLRGIIAKLEQANGPVELRSIH